MVLMMVNHNHFLFKCKNLLKSSLCNFCGNRYLHQYRLITPWKNTVEFTDHLINTAIYFNHGVLALNKPYGITFSRDGVANVVDRILKPDPEQNVFVKQSIINKQIKTIKSRFCTSGMVNSHLDLVNCLPYLKRHYGLEKLHLSRVPEIYASGVALLATSKDLVEKINRCHLQPPAAKDVYHMVVVGVPKHNEGEVQIGLKLDQDPNKGKRVMLLQKWGKKAQRLGNVRVATFHYKTISVGYDNLTSLIEVGVNVRKHHAYRVFASDYLLSPVLGDNLLGSRVQTVMGVPVPVHHFNDVADTPQKLPKVVYDLLQLGQSEASLIPVHVHLSSITLPNFHQGQFLQLEAPAPPHFLWTCERLGLLSDQPELATIADHNNKL